jgi:hypothetical protein
MPPYLTAAERLIYDKLVKLDIVTLLRRARERCVQVIVPPNAKINIKIKAVAYSLVKAGYGVKPKTQPKKRKK